jgi:hypothetical protein
MRWSRPTGLMNSTSRVSDCRAADAQGVPGPRPGRVQLIMVQNRGESLCREIEEKVDQWGVNRIKAGAVVLP